MFYAIKHPDRLNSLILCNSTPSSSAFRMTSFRIMQERTTSQDSVAKEALIATQGFRDRDARVLEKFFRLLFRGSFANPYYADSLILTLPDDYSARSKFLGYLSKDPVSGSYDITDRLRVIRCPAIVVGGDRDLVPVEANEKIAAAIPGGRAITLPHCGHFPFVEQPKALFAAIRGFLSGVPRTEMGH